MNPIFRNHSKKERPHQAKNGLYRDTERGFERLTSVVTAVLGNSITFIVALLTVLFWLSNKRFYT
jgi:hypothetical protein